MGEKKLGRIFSIWKEYCKGPKKESSESLAEFSESEVEFENEVEELIEEFRRVIFFKIFYFFNIFY